MSTSKESPMFHVPNEAGQENIKTPAATATPKTEVPAEDPEMEKEYVHESSVSIALVQSYSLYRKANSKVLPKRVDYIGGSVTASRILSANKKEVETYFPNIIGLSPNNEKFVTEVKIWLGNIRIPVDELGKTFNTSFHYYHKKDYVRFAEQLEKIENDYAKVNRNDLEALKKALDTKIMLTNALESEKCVYGYPINIEDYLMYRHCLLYKDIAKDLAFINSDNNIRFYFKDDAKEAEKNKKFHEQVVKAMSNYVNAIADSILFDAVYTQYCVLNNYPVVSSLAKPRIERETDLMEFSRREPVKFNKIYSNPNLKLMAEIELLIAHGELVRSEYNQQISTAEGVTIGANMNEAVAWFKKVENTSAVNAYRAKLRNS